ncbi:hypothetical protein C7M61_003853 [Candidozyma pseudohaemuli]|uniref:Uncharacterized protein n=1 Tax=Candidozyma pseudohaemuli TaxID=418784 RepID=A0A2P7YK86_9ASCO|nr:hypothetical protein C7M61_003853 [[Candida] pseudohaemulonii]PSK36384.1 hypothetical protein C7M61_003853 [[Candida] pseudohaemulonii]
MSTRGHRLGTFKATWNKLKAATLDNSGVTENGAVTDSDLPNQEEPLNLNGTNGSAKPESKAQSRIVEFGPRGEMCVYYPDQMVLELWDWCSPNTQAYRGDSLNLIRSVSLNKQLVALKVGDFAGLPGVVFTTSDTVHMYIHGYKEQYLALPSYFKAPHTIKLSRELLTIGSANGYICILNFRQNTGIRLDPYELHNIHQNITRPIADKEGITTDWLFLKACVSNDAPIYDLQGSWLVYCPTKTEMDHQRHLLHSHSNSTKKKESRLECLFTDVKLPPSGPLLMRVVSSISGSALDKLYALSETGSKTIREYWLKPKGAKSNILDKDVSLHSISNNISQTLYSTANKIKKLTQDSGEHKYIRLINLHNGQMIATFKPPGGVSHLSLSPYDLQLVQASAKGDAFYLWDLYRLPKEASLVGKFVRGNTSATINDICWFVNSEGPGCSDGTNAGFGCISKKSGSLHWYNINYLSRGIESNNHPNKLGGKSRGFSSDQFLDSWVLPSIGACRFVKLPKVSNLPSRLSEELTLDKKLFEMDQLAFYDKTGDLRLVSPLNGKHTFKYVLPKESLQKPVAQELSGIFPFPRATGPSKEDKKFETPLSQTEIETCAQYLSVINDKRFELSTFELAGEKDIFDYLEDFGLDIPTRRVDFRGAPQPQLPVLNGDSVAALDKGLLINPEISGEELS